MKSRVAVMKSSPATVIEDYGKLMRLAGYEQALPGKSKTILNTDISWRVWYPACSTAPWQLEGVIQTMLDDGYPPDSITLVHNRAAAGPGTAAQINNGLATVAQKFGLGFTRLSEPAASWTGYEPQAELLVLDKMSGPQGIRIPDNMMGTNIVQLPTVKTHASLGTAGAMENAVGSLLQDMHQSTHGVVHETLVDLLAIQREIHTGVFAVMDGTFCGDGAGPRTMVPYEKSYILASADPVAIDAVAAAMMGFDPMAIKYLRLAHERGLGCAVPAEMEIVGEDISDVDFHFEGAQQHHRAASLFYQDYYWYPFVGWPRVGRMAETGWGQLLQGYLPDGAELEAQGNGKGTAMAVAAATALLGMSALSRVARLAGRS